MSSREKKLFIFFAIAGFAIINFVAVNWVISKRNEIKSQRDLAQQELTRAELFRESSSKITDQMEWLAQHELPPASNQDVQTKLQKIGESEARNAGLTIKSQKHRANFQFVVTGTEEALYRWFDRLNMPDQFRVASQINMKPNQQDDTKIDCSASVAQWFVPSTL